jgi:16S rRNA G966 N2-methylase RsmD
MLKSFIINNLNSDLHRLLLTAQRYPDIDMPYAVSQIEALRKVKDKIPSWFNPALQFPPSLSLEQSSSEAAATYKSALFSGQIMADLTGGMGIDSFFWSKSFDTVHYVEQSEQLCRVAQHNFEVLSANGITVHHSDAAAFLAQNTSRFDLVYLDPARRDQQKNKVFLLSDCTPNIVELMDEIFKHTDQILLKTAPMLDIALAVKDLKKVSKIWVCALNNECKEVLYLIDNKSVISENEIEIQTVNLLTGMVNFQFTKAEELNAPMHLGVPQNYLYEPDTALLKAGAFKVFASRYGLNKLHTHTHLYTSDQLMPEMPARSFKIIDVVKYSADAVKSVIKDSKANIAVRNFPDTVQEMRKKLKLADGGHYYLFGATILEDKKVILVCEKVISGINNTV